MCRYCCAACAERAMRMDFLAHHILSVVLFTPLLGALLLLFIPRENEQAHKVAGNIFGALGFLVSLPLLRWFKPGWGGFAFEETADWIPSIGAKYHLGIDGGDPIGGFFEGEAAPSGFEPA